MSIVINKACLDLIKQKEGLQLKAYHDSIDKDGVDTIGYGTIQYPPYYLGGKMVKVGDMPITELQALDFLNYEVEQKAKLIDPMLRDDLTPNQFAALISFAYNLGENNLKISTLRKKVNVNPNDPTIRDEFTKWCYADGVKVNGLLIRRKQEADLYFTK
jgi:lysozyme